MPQGTLIIGLTGGIASGKSAVAERFADLGVPVIDTDAIARQLAGPVTGEIVRALGREAVGPDGRLRRDWLRRRIFEDDEARRRLEGILHPRIREEVQTRVSRITAPYCIVVAPLLFEAQFEREVDRVLVVDADPETRLERLMQRDDMSETDARKALAAQLDPGERRRRADDVIDNNDAIEQLDAQVRALHERYLRLAGAAP